MAHAVKTRMGDALAGSVHAVTAGLPMVGGNDPHRPACGPTGYATPNCLLMNHCWAMPRMLFVNQYSTSPAGK